MTQAHEADLQRLLRLPWTILREVTPEGDVLLRVKEIPSAVGSGETEEELVADLWESLSESLHAYLHFGDSVPLPRGASESWVRLNGSLASTNKPFVVTPASAKTGTSTALT